LIPNRNIQITLLAVSGVVVFPFPWMKDKRKLFIPPTR